MTFKTLIAGLVLCATVSAGAQVRVSTLSPTVILLQTPHANIVATAGPEGAIAVGAMDTASARAVADSLTAHAGSPRRFVIAIAGLASIGQADAGWDARGALVIMQEFAYRRMQRPTAPGLRQPRGEFSQFLSLELNGEPLHAVRQEPGYANSDVLVHFETSNVVYLGESYPGDGYPRIDASLKGTVEGLLQTLAPWTQPGGTKFVGARGPVASADDIRVFRDMVAAVRDRVRSMKDAGRSVDDVIASRPTAAFDQRYGRGVVSAERFIRDVYVAEK